MNNIQWVFFDIGSTLVDEYIPYRWRYDQMIDHIRAHAGRDVPYEEVESLMYQAGYYRNAPYFYALKRLGIPRPDPLPAYRRDMERPYPDAAPLLRQLREQGYHLGVIANQGPGLPDRLKKFGLFDLFDPNAVFGSEDVGLRKPDTAFYRYALEQTHCQPKEAVMVGDRPDNDIGPAHKVGMKAVRYMNCYFITQIAQTPEEQSDGVIHALYELPELLTHL